MYFLDNYKKTYIKSIIKEILINLVLSDLEKLLNLLYNIINYIVFRFGVNPIDYNNFWEQIIDNNNRNIIAFFNLLLPFIDDKENYYIYKKIYRISDISLKDITNVSDNYNDEENKTYEYKNILINYCILLNTIDSISNKLYVNWIYVIPICINNYKESYLYKNSVKFIEKNIINEKKEIFIYLKKFNINKHNDNILFKIIDNKLSVNKKLLKKKIEINKLYYADNEIVDVENRNNVYSEIINYNNNDFDINYELLYKNKGISILDIINTIYYDLFLDIVKIKWLIYQDTFDDDNIDEIYIKKFNEYIKIDELYYNIKWGELDKERQFFFENQWNNFLKLVLIKNNKKRNSYFYLLINIIIFMERNFDKMHYIETEYNYKKITKSSIYNNYDDDDRNDDDDEINNNDNMIYINEIKKIPIEYIYSYLLITIQKFISTWYGKKIVTKIEYNKDLQFNYESYFSEYIEKDDIFPEKLTIKYKFIYNYAKSYSLIYVNNKPYLRMSWNESIFRNRLIMSLNRYTEYNKDNNESDTIFDMSDIYIMNYSKYYLTRYINYNINNNIINNEYIKTYFLYFFTENIKKKLIDITFESHIYKGLYSEFNYNKNNIKDFLLKKKYNENSYYYLTNKLYTEKFINNITNDIEKKKNSWFTYYAMDWVFQINFFHRYINNRIMYITGATGQGKSTQIPKLFLYSLLMINRNNNGKVICSQPRIDPTISNSEIISIQLGYPIKEYVKKYDKKLKTFNPYVQYKSKKDSHLVEDNYSLELKIVTDKILFDYLINNPIFKKLQKKKKEDIFMESDENIYMDENLYDILIVDEAHEHNVNMDLILTLARETIRINNSLKLIIISATLDEDESLYREYYRNINDNFMYPYNFYNAKKNFDRFFVDRRIHISPPGETTKFKIKEKYLENEPENYKKAEEYGITKLLELIKSTTIGDILFFTLGLEDIKNINKIINSNLDIHSKVICLPFHSRLRVNFIDFNNIKKTLENLDVNREDIFLKISNKEYRKVSKGYYNRAIIIATDIAEASITIDSLKYIIDTGYHKIVTFNDAILDSEFSDEKITNSSRKQRKGRVGRVNDGEIYYMYKKNSRDKIKTKYKICIQNISDEIFSLLKKNKLDKLIFIESINLSNYIYIDIPDDILNIIKENYNKNNIYKILIEKQYMLTGVILPSIYNIYSYKNDKQNSIYTNDLYNYNFDQKRTEIYFSNNRYYSGYDMKTIFDQNEKKLDTDVTNFYLIHPTNKIDENEKKLDTNVNNFIYQNNKLDKNKHSFRLINIINNLIENKYIIINNKLLDWNKSTILNIDYEKSNLSIIFQKISDKMTIFEENSNINLSFIMTLIYSYICNIDDIVIIMICLIIISEFKLSNLNNNINIFKHLIENDVTDLFIYYKLSKKILENINKNIIFNNLNMKYNKEREIFINQKKKINIYGIEAIDIPLEIYNKFNILYNTNRISNYNIDDYIVETYKEYYVHEVNFIKIFNDININNEIVIDKFIKLYFYIKSEYDKIKGVYMKEDNLEWFKKNIPININKNEWINIKNSFIYGFSNNIVLYNYNDSYYNINNIKLNYKLIKKTFHSKSYFNLFLHNIKNEIYIIFDVNLEDIFNINPSVYSQKIYDYHSNKIFKEFIIKLDIIQKKRIQIVSHYRNYNNNNKDLKLNNSLNNKKNNLIPYFIKLFTQDYNNQYGGNIKDLKIRSNMIPYIINKLNISIFQLIDIILQLNNEYNIIIDRKKIEINIL